MEKIFVISDYDKRMDDVTTLEMLSKAAELAKASQSKVVLFSARDDFFDASVKTVAYYGADIIYAVCSESPVSSSVYRVVLSDLIRRDMPKCVIFTDSETGKEISARLSIMLDCGLTADCVDIILDNSGEYVFIRTALNDSVVARIKGDKQAVKMTTVKKGAIPLRKREVDPNLTEVYDLACSYKESWLNGLGLFEILQEIAEEEVEAVDISKSKILFCAGRGIQNKESLDLLFALAEKIGAQVACSRSLVDDGIMPRERQVGQSGKSVSPSIYFALGVSGACQHIVGIKNAGFVIAVNTDPRAPIFSFADYSIIADAKAVIREMYNKSTALNVRHASGLVYKS